MKKIIREQILTDVGQIKHQPESILADRVLFACSLTNLQPISLTPQDSEDFPLVKESYKSTTSYSHKELRVFDLRFAAQEAGVIPHWITYDMDTLRKEESWAELAATAVACGAFPVAFEPVVLERTQEEFSFILSLDGADKQHPYRFINNFESFKFPYVDGGTFNNEPIREAFRLAFHLDTQRRRKYPEQDFDRLIIFVDPIVSPDSPGFNLSAFNPYKLSGKKVKKKNPMGKLFPLAGTMIGMLRDEGSVKEENKIRNFTQTVKLRRTLFNYLDDIISRLPKSALEADLWDSMVDSIEKRLNRNFIPLGDGDAEEYLLLKLEENYAAVSSEMEVTSRSSSQSVHFDFFEELIAELLKDKTGFEELKSMLVLIKRDEKNRGIAQSVEGEMVEILKTNLRKAFLNLVVDFALDLDGKDEKAMRVSVTPVAYGEQTDEVKTIKLPGSEMEAFTGFGVKNFQFASFNYGRYCALKALSRNDFRMYHFQAINKKRIAGKPPFVAPEKAEELIQKITFTPEATLTHDEYMGEIKENLFRPLTKRVGSLLSLWIRNPILKLAMGIGVWLPKFTIGNNSLIFSQLGKDMFEKEPLPGLTILLKGTQFEHCKKYRFDADMPWFKGLWDENESAFVVKAFLNKKDKSFLLSHLPDKGHQFELVPQFVGNQSEPDAVNANIEAASSFWKGRKNRKTIELNGKRVFVAGKEYAFAEMLSHIDLFNNPVFIYDGEVWSLEDKVEPFAKIL